MESLAAAQVRHPFRFVFLRLSAVFGLAGITSVLLHLGGVSHSFPPLFSLYFWATTLICAFALRRTLRGHGVGVRQYLDLERSRVWRDLAGSLVWLVVGHVCLLVPMMLAMYVMFGAEMFAGFERIFQPEQIAVPRWAMIAFLLVSSILFVLNAPIEEMIFRGWLQRGLTARHGVAVAVVVQSLLFGVQHMAFAYTPSGMVVYAFGFVGWGAAAGVIAHMQGQLAQITMAHWVVNILMGVVPGIAVAVAMMIGAV